MSGDEQGRNMREAQEQNAAERDARTDDLGREKEDDGGGLIDKAKDRISGGVDSAKDRVSDATDRDTQGVVTRPDEPIPGGPGPDEEVGLPPDAPEEEQAPFEIDTDKLRVQPDDEQVDDGSAAGSGVSGPGPILPRRHIGA